MGILSSRYTLRRIFSRLLLATLTAVGTSHPQNTVAATTVPLLLPGGLAYDAAGSLYFAETARHVVRRVSSSGVITVIAGTGTQGFGGDGAAAISAELDSPAAVALDDAGDLFIADTHNHRIRRVDVRTGLISTLAGNGVADTSPDGTAATAAAINLPAAMAFDRSGDLFFADVAAHRVRRIDASTGLVRTVAGNGVQGYSGDGGAATAAQIDSPAGIVLDAAGNLYLADSHNHSVRRVDAVSGVITTVAGNGQPGFAGDAGDPRNAQLHLPRGLALDANGSLWIVDSLNQRIRRVDSLTGQITTFVGNGTQGYSGDGGPALSATLDSPRAIAFAPGDLPVFSDSGNGRIREVDSSVVVHTVAGLGTTLAATLNLSAPSVVLYGTGAVTATLAASPATGSVTFFDKTAGAAQPILLGSVAMQSNTAVDSTATLAAGAHDLTATYPGDATHPPAASTGIAVMVTPVTATATLNPASMLYGQAVPVLSGTLTGILPQDAGAVTLAVDAAATPASAPGAYPISAALAGAAAGNYALTQSSAALTITKAPILVSLTPSLAAQVTSTTSGTPTGVVSLLDGANSYGTVRLDAGGAAVFSSTGLSTGSHTLTALYAGDGDFLSGTSIPLIVTIGAAGTPDFTLACVSSTSVTVPAGNAAAFSFTLTAVNGAMSSPILLTAAGLPSGATASFSPAYLPPGTSAANFTLTIQTIKLAEQSTGAPLIVVACLPALIFWRRRRSVACVSVLLLLAGCGNRVNQGSTFTNTRSYNVTVLATSTSATGATVQHTSAITLTLQ